MSAIILLPIILPAAWPAVAAAAAAAASALGFAAAKSKAGVHGETEVELEMENTGEVTDEMSRGEEIAFVKGDIRVVFSRSTDGKMAVKVCGRGKSEQELRALGQELTMRVTQQYAYHRLMTELKQRNFSVVGEEVEEDGTVRLQVRTFQG